MDSIYFTGTNESMMDNRFGSLLVSRGWTLQEEALSTRYLSFQPRQISLRIFDTIYHENGTSQHVDKTTYSMASLNHLTKWTGLIEDYTMRFLTNEDDMLPALSGLAQLYNQQNGAKYLAGIWQDYLREQLCWFADIMTAVDSERERHSRPKKYRAPSWSWASINGPVTFSSSGALSPHSTISYASTVLVGQDNYGRVQSGSLVLRTRISQQLWRRRPGSQKKWYYEYPVQNDPNPEWLQTNMPYTNATPMLDVDIAEDELRIWSVPLLEDYALALQPVVDEESTFARIGAIYFRSKKRRWI